MLTKKLVTELKTTLNLSIPIIVGQLGVVLMAVADNIMVGQLLGKTALGAAGVANSIAFLIASLAVGGLAVIAPMVSKNIAENNIKYLKKLFVNTNFVAVFYGTVLSLIGLTVYFNFGILKQSEQVTKLSPSFLLTILGSNFFLYLFVALKQFGDGLSKPRVAMIITIIGLIFNVSGNYVLIKGLGFIPKLGLNGAAIATLITRAVMFLILAIYFYSNIKFSSIFRDNKWLPDYRIFFEILRRSIPGGFQFFFEIGAFSTAVIMMGWISETALAAHHIAINIASSTYMMATGISFAAGIRVGDAWGRRDAAAIKIAGNAGYIMVFAFMTLSMLIIFFFKLPILHFYISDVDVIQIATPLLTIAAIFQLSDGLQVVGLGVLRGLADIKIPTAITFVAYWVIALPAGYFLGFKTGMGANGIWTGLLLGLTASAIFLYFRYRFLVNPKIINERFLTKKH